MTTQNAKTSPCTYARIAGALYLVLFILGPFAFFMGRTGIVVPNDPGATLGNLMASAWTFRFGMVAETFIVLVEIIICALLYVLLKPVSRPLSLAAALARFAQAILQAVSLFTAVPALLLLNGDRCFAALATDPLNAMVLLFMNINAFVIMIWGLIFGFHLLLLGYLVYRSGFLPKILGVLIFIASVGYLSQSYGHILLPQYDGILATIVVVLSVPGELAFALWLLVKGIDGKRWEERALPTG